MTDQAQAVPRVLTLPTSAIELARRQERIRPAAQRRRWLGAAFLLGTDLVVGLVATVVADVGPAPFLVAAGWTALVAATAGYRVLALPGLRSASPNLFGPAVVMLLLVELGPATAVPRLRGPMLATIACLLVAGRLNRTLCVERRWLPLGGPSQQTRALLVGSRGSLTAVLRERRDDLERSVTLVGACVVGPHRSPRPALEFDAPTAVGLESVPQAVARLRAEAVFVVPGPRLGTAAIRRLCWLLEPTNAEVLVLSGLPDSALRRTEVVAARSLPLVHLCRPKRARGLVLKQVWERPVALLALLMTAPLLAVLALLIRLESPGPAIFRQVRVGLGERTFTMFKLRTMTDGAHQQVSDLRELDEGAGVLFKVRADPRVTRVGRLLRRYSLDELPQLWNVVRGDMALIGPRPPLPEEVNAYDDDVRHRLVVRPGLTGLWQVSGRSDLPWSEAVRLDLYYVDNWSIGLDLSILRRTAAAVLSHAGAY